MFFFGPWPYAGKALIQHEFDTDHLNVWITFPHAMDTEDHETEAPIKPPDNLWFLKADNAPVLILNSAWQDKYTLLLTSDIIASAPARVLLEYDGPHADLRISWHKQWEPWGPILSLDITT